MINQCLLVIAYARTTKSAFYRFEFVRNLFVGTLAAAISKTLTAPIEHTHLRWQLMDYDIEVEVGGLEKPDANLIDCARRITREEGLTSL